MIGQKFIEKTDYWHIIREVTGYNGSGGFWITEKWNWPSGDTCREHILTLSLEQSKNLKKSGTLRRQY